MFLIWLAVTLWNVVSPWPDRWWADYFWGMGVVLALAVGAITGVWFTIGGLRDLWRLFRALAVLERDVHDDGRVTDPPGVIVEAPGAEAPAAPAAGGVEGLGARPEPRSGSAVVMR